MRICCLLIISEFSIERFTCRYPDLYREFFAEQR
jgi:hypothetical protein